MVKHNSALVYPHLRKHWQGYVRTWFNQPARKHRRLIARKLRAKNVSPRPVDKLRPIVNCHTLKYQSRMKLGRGFTLEEIKAAGLNKGLARSIGISVDHRRVDVSKEKLEMNINRLKNYLSKLILFPYKKNDKEDTKKRMITNATK